jgi:flagellar protein FlaF
MSHEAYRRASREFAAPRDVEYAAFSEATRRLIAADAAGPAELALRIDAVHRNRALWGVIAEDCGRDANLLPTETRARLIALARWVADYSSEAMRKRETLQPLIDVNRIIMDGLAGRAAAG